MNDEKDQYFYLANLGPEAKRALRFYEKGMMKESVGASERAKSIIERFLSIAETEGAREEALLLSDLLTHLDEGKQALSQEALDRYFEPFALRAMGQKR